MCSKETRIAQMLVVAVKDIWAVALHLSDMLTGYNIIGHMDRKKQNSSWIEEILTQGSSSTGLYKSTQYLLLLF